MVLRILLEEESVTGAGRRLGLSPSATSHALGRLREAFADPLLVRVGNRMLPTPRAAALRPGLERVLDEAGLLYRALPSFEARTSSRRFDIAASDLLAPLVPALVGRLGREAPGIALALRPEVPASDTEAFASGQFDLALRAEPEATPGLAIRSLGTTDFVVAARAGHPFLKKPDLGEWLAAPHVVVGNERPGVGYVGQALARAGIERRVGLRVPSFLLALHALSETSLLFSAPGPLVRPVARRLRLRTAPLPLEIPDVRIAAIWHERFAADPGHRWFRKVVCDSVGRGLAEGR